MTSIEERDFWQQYAREDYEGVGEMVDLGCWLGSTTIPLVRRLLQNRKLRKRARSYTPTICLFGKNG